MDLQHRRRWRWRDCFVVARSLAWGGGFCVAAAAATAAANTACRRLLAAWTFSAGGVAAALHHCFRICSRFIHVFACEAAPLGKIPLLHPFRWPWLHVVRFGIGWIVQLFRCKFLIFTCDLSGFQAMWDYHVESFWDWLFLKIWCMIKSIPQCCHFIYREHRLLRFMFTLSF